LKIFQAKKRAKIFFSWLLVFLSTATILLIVPFARTIQSFVSARWGHSFFGYLVLIVVGAAFLILLLFLLFRLKIRSLTNYFWLSLVTALYVYFTLKLWNVPVEAVHFLEYGLLGLFLFRALKFHVKDKSIYIIAFFCGSLVGIFDEIFQWMVPLRFWDIRDVGFNALSSGLIQIGLWKGIQPKGISLVIKGKSIRTLSLLLSVNVVLLGVCLSNTPQRVSAYTKRLPALSFLRKEDVMNRFRYTHKDKEIGSFYSLLSLSELKREDSENFLQAGKIIKEWKNRDYQDFLRHFSPLNQTFIYELGAHLEIRDEYYNKAIEAANEETRKKFFTVAYKENLILEKYFGQTLQTASYQWGIEQLNQVEFYLDRDLSYKSPLRFGLLFSFSEKTMWISIFAFLFILVLINIFLLRLQKFR